MRGTRTKTGSIRFPLAAVALAAALGAAAQPPAPPPLDAMERLAFLTGTWQGSGWMELEPGRRAGFDSREVVEPRLGGRVLLVEGTHTAAMGEPPRPVVVHHALGVFSHDAAEGYRFRTWLANGREGDFAAELAEDGALVWGYDDPRRGRVRYTIRLSAEGEWVEVGEASRDGGASWHQFFEMKLAKQ